MFTNVSYYLIKVYPGDRCKGENDDQGTPNACIADEGDDRKSDTDEIAINNYKGIHKLFRYQHKSTYPYLIFNGHELLRFTQDNKSAQLHLFPG